MGLLATVLLLQAGAAEPEALGSVLRQDGFQFRPPRGFHASRMDLYHGTRVGGLSLRGAARYLSTVLVDGDTEDAASLLVSVVEEPLSLGPSARDELSTAVVRHFRDDLGQTFQLERAELNDGRVEVLGSIRGGGQLRRVLVAAWPGDERHLVALSSVPSGRWSELSAALGQSLATMRIDSPAVVQPPVRLVWAFAALLAALLVGSVGLWRRRQAARKLARRDGTP